MKALASISGYVLHVELSKALSGHGLQGCNFKIMKCSVYTRWFRDSQGGFWGGHASREASHGTQNLLFFPLLQGQPRPVPGLSRAGTHTHAAWRSGSRGRGPPSCNCSQGPLQWLAVADAHAWPGWAWPQRPSWLGAEPRMAASGVG